MLLAHWIQVKWWHLSSELSTCVHQAMHVKRLVATREWWSLFSCCVWSPDQSASTLSTGKSLCTTWMLRKGGEEGRRTHFRANVVNWIVNIFVVDLNCQPQFSELLLGHPVGEQVDNCVISCRDLLSSQLVVSTASDHSFSTNDDDKELGATNLDNCWSCCAATPIHQASQACIQQTWLMFVYFPFLLLPPPWLLNVCSQNTHRTRMHAIEIGPARSGLGGVEERSTATADFADARIAGNAWYQQHFANLTVDTAPRSMSRYAPHNNSNNNHNDSILIFEWYFENKLNLISDFGGSLTLAWPSAFSTPWTWVCKSTFTYTQSWESSGCCALPPLLTSFNQQFQGFGVGSQANGAWPASWFFSLPCRFLLSTLLHVVNVCADDHNAMAMVIVHPNQSFLTKVSQPAGSLAGNAWCCIKLCVPTNHFCHSVPDRKTTSNQLRRLVTRILQSCCSFESVHACCENGEHFETNIQELSANRHETWQTHVLLVVRRHGVDPLQCSSRPSQDCLHHQDRREKGSGQRFVSAFVFDVWCARVVMIPFCTLSPFSYLIGGKNCDSPTLIKKGKGKGKSKRGKMWVFKEDAGDFVWYPNGPYTFSIIIEKECEDSYQDATPIYIPTYHPVGDGPAGY